MFGSLFLLNSGLIIWTSGLLADFSSREVTGFTLVEVAVLVVVVVVADWLEASLVCCSCWSCSCCCFCWRASASSWAAAAIICW